MAQELGPHGMASKKRQTMQAEPRTSHSFERYVSAREYVVANGYESELDWQASRHISKITETEFLREAAWVILNSGMREAVVRQKFPAVEKAFMHFESAVQIVENRQYCLERAHREFAHSGKLHAIVSVAFRVATDGFVDVRATTEKHGVAYLKSFDFVGPVTSKHLAKNLGLPVSKSDRHLVRISNTLGFGSVSEMCSTLSDLSGDAISVVDLVLWRFATLNSSYEEWFARPDGEEFTTTVQLDASQFDRHIFQPARA